MTPFERALAFTLEWEGGFANDPHDPGGMTFAGISRVANPNWPGWIRVDNMLVGSRTPSTSDPDLMREVTTLYRWRYWNSDDMPLEPLPPPVSLVMFDSGVQHGPARARRWLQQVLGVTGYLERASWQGEPNETAYQVVLRRCDHLARWLKADPDRLRYVRGFWRRLLSLTREIHRLRA